MPTELQRAFARAGGRGLLARKRSPFVTDGATRRQGRYAARPSASLFYRRVAFVCGLRGASTI